MTNLQEPDAQETDERAWDQAELVRLMDVERSAPGRYEAPAHGSADRNVVEAGQLLADAVVAASKEIVEQRVLSASMVFSRAAQHDQPLAVDLEILQRGRTYSTVEARVRQQETLRSTGLLLLGSEAEPLISGAAPLPDVPPPSDVPTFARDGMHVAGRELRIVNDAYDLDPAHVGPPELFVWTRFAQAPTEQHLHMALMTHSITHWTIAAALRPHAGYSESMAHREISTGISKATVAYHDPVDVSRWLLYGTRVFYTGRGTTQSEGRVYDEDGRLVASCTVHGMLRPLATGRAHSPTAL